MALSRLLATTNHELTTTAVGITTPEAIRGKAVTVVLGCTLGDEFVSWRRQAEVGGSEASALCLAGKETLQLSVSAGAVPFCGKALTGTATLEVEWWG